ncbi:arrestin domain-containing protein [Colletotrichum truncatum]|uniref:Arrestin domain-containing protein n=1 Tax=Colletotrichum truncatum TaxID=5467 RepID=A0ACC3ZD13_COLTU|nr:arrestin domain-containing protein [Colletotrichum truncatum]KAF6797972.1 arrestin domain-containing protein [Colletotrichum truncatum]
MRSITNQVSSMVKLPGMATRPKELDISVDNHYTSRVYTCGSAISGSVVINPRRNTKFNFVQIHLISKTTVTTDDAYISKSTSQLLLKVSMPVPESVYPEPRVFKIGTTYKIPFRFVIPSQLTDGACVHNVDSDEMRDRHLRLPSTLTGWEKDDMAPTLLGVKYFVRARVMYLPQGKAEDDAVALLEAEHRLRVLAQSPEDPPLNVDKYDKHYRLSQIKLMRKSMFSTPLGRIIANSTQPPAIHLSPDGHGAGGSSVQIDLAFEPHVGNIVPPEVTLNSLKIVAHTWYCSQPIQNLPNMGPGRIPFSLSAKVVCDSLEYESWKKPRTTSSGVLENEDKEGVKIRPYTSSVRVDFRLPTSDHVFPPTFHSCLVSRTYALQANLTAGGCDFSLVLPIQIAMDAGDQTQGWAIQNVELPGWTD